MSEPIKVGDLVMVVKPAICCGSPRRIGLVVRVTGLTNGERTRCTWCSLSDVVPLAEYSSDLCIDIRRLKRIDPPAIGDSLPMRKTVKEPA